MKLAIIGSRGFNNYELLKEILEPYKNRIDLIVSGAAKGADTLGEKWAIENNIKTLIFPADWEKYGKAAGYIRNHDIVDNSDSIIAFWDGNSHGTKHSIAIAKKSGKPTQIIEYNDK